MNKNRKKGRLQGKSGKQGKQNKPGAEDNRDNQVPGDTNSPSREASLLGGIDWQDKRLIPWGIAGALLAICFFWSYWPTVANLVAAWDREPDYSHGYFVVPLALFFLWARRDNFPGFPNAMAWPGLVLIGLSIAIRTFGARYYVDAIDGWSILFWVAGVVWFLGGWRIFCWSLPSIAFLWFMIPLPWRVERWLSLPLQGIATKISCWGLQFFGQPALYEGNVIHINDFPLEVAEACSGLRIFVGIVALAFAYLVLFRRAWWERALLVASVLPIALVANSTRIICTGLLNQWVSGEAAHKFTHDIAGYVMIPFAAGLFALVLLYLDQLVRDVEVVDMKAFLREENGQASST